MPTFQTSDCELYYEDDGEGPPIVFIHGLWLTSRFFRKQIEHFARSHRVIVPDLRGHGRSEKVLAGHTVPQQTRDLRQLIDGLGLTDVILVGWSSGAFCVWEWINQHGCDNLRAVVIIDESPADFNWPDWTLGAHSLQTLMAMMETVQRDHRGLVTNFFVNMLFKQPPPPEDAAWMIDEITMIPPAIAGVVAFDELTRDYRDTLGNVDVPTLVCFGEHDQFLPQENGPYLVDAMPSARLVTFANSGHAPFYEEPDRFNSELAAFVRSLSRPGPIGTPG